MSQLNIFNIDIFHSFLSCLATLFDRKLQVFKKKKIAKIDHFWHF